MAGRKTYLDVPYTQRELAKKHGARWDPSVKRWYYLPGARLAKIFHWRDFAQFGGTSIGGSLILSVPDDEHSLAAGLGAHAEEMSKSIHYTTRDKTLRFKLGDKQSCDLAKIYYWRKKKAKT